MKPRLYCHISPEAEAWMNEFVVPVASKEFDIIPLRTHDIRGKDNVFLRVEWISALLRQEPEFVFFTGVDVLYAKPIYARCMEEMAKGYDLLTHFEKWGGICSDFLVLRCCDRTRAWWSKLLGEKECYQDGRLWEMEAMSRLRSGINYLGLPREEFYTCCNAEGLNGDFCTGWHPSEKDVPKTARIVHAACVKEPEKVEVLRLVKSFLLP